MCKILTRSSIPGLGSLVAVILGLTSMLTTAVIETQPSQALSHIETKATEVSSEANDSSVAEAAKATAQLIDSFKASLNIYKQQPDSETWAATWQNFKALIWHCIVKHPSQETAIRSIAALKDSGLRCTVGSNVKIWGFPNLADCQQILVEWKETSYPKRPPLVGKRGRLKAKKPLPAVVVTRIQSAACPPNTQIDDARIVRPESSSDHPSSLTRTDATPLLVLTGVNRKTAAMWLAGYRLSDGNWLPYPEMFSEIPPYFAQNLRGKASFSGTSLILTVGEAKAPVVSENADEKSEAQSGGYKITFRLSESHYVFDNRLSADLSADPPAAIAVQFAQAIQKGRQDLTKAWLSDPQLASLPAYLGLYNRPAGAPLFKLVRMASQAPGVTRFRLITFAKNDLILDIAKVKVQWLVKALFIAPADPLAKAVAGIVAKD